MPPLLSHPGGERRDKSRRYAAGTHPRSPAHAPRAPPSRALRGGMPFSAAKAAGTDFYATFAENAAACGTSASMYYDDIIGQDDIKARLARDVAEGHVPHARLFCGPPGCGKLATALAYAASLLCERPVEGRPCGECPSCKMTARWVHPDLHFTFPVVRPRGRSGDVTSDVYLAQWREQLCRTPYFDMTDWLRAMDVENQQAMIYAAESDAIVQRLSLTASRGGWRVLVVWHPELMNETAANKLLKILEEPPARTAFVLVSDRPDRLLSTIVSRTQRVAFPPLPEEVMARTLSEQRGLDADDARAVAHAAAGSYTRALARLVANEDEALFFDLFVLLMRLSYMRKVKDMHDWAQQVASWGRERQKDFLQYCQRQVRENFVYNFRLPALNYQSRREADFSRRFARFVNERNVVGIMNELAAAQRDIEQNVSPRMVFFDLALKMIVLLIQ